MEQIADMGLGPISVVVNCYQFQAFHKGVSIPARIGSRVVEATEDSILELGSGYGWTIPCDWNDKRTRGFNDGGDWFCLFQLLSRDEKIKKIKKLKNEKVLRTTRAFREFRVIIFDF